VYESVHDTVSSKRFPRRVAGGSTFRARIGVVGRHRDSPSFSGRRNWLQHDAGIRGQNAVGSRAVGQSGSREVESSVRGNVGGGGAKLDSVLVVLVRESGMSRGASPGHVARSDVGAQERIRPRVWRAACGVCRHARDSDRTSAKNGVARIAACGELHGRQRDGESRATELRVTVNFHRSTEF